MSTQSFIDINADTAPRMRRNWQRIADGYATGTIKVVAPITNSYVAASNTGGIGVAVDGTTVVVVGGVLTAPGSGSTLTASPPLYISADNISLVNFGTNTNPGLLFYDTNLNPGTIDYYHSGHLPWWDSGSGLPNGPGLAVNLVQGGGLTVNTSGSGGLEVQLAPGGGLGVGGTGLYISAGTVPNTASNGDMLYWDGSTAAWTAFSLNSGGYGILSYNTAADIEQWIAPGTSGQVLTSNGTSALASFQAAFTNPMTTKGDIIYENATPAPARLAVGALGEVLSVSSSGIPQWGGSAYAVNSGTDTENTSTTSEQFFASGTGFQPSFAANYLAAGQTYRITFGATFQGNTALVTARFKLYFGGSSTSSGNPLIFDSGTITCATAFSNYTNIVISAIVSVQAAGALATIATAQASTASTTIDTLPTYGTTNFSVTTSNSNIVSGSVTFSTASTNNKADATNMLVERLS